MRRIRLELLLILAVVLLAGQLAWPALTHWWRRPGPGRVGVGQFEHPTLASEYLVYLPRDYHTKNSWPLVVFLHGSGECGNDPTMLCGRGPFAVVQQGTPLPAIVVAPQCVPGSDWDPEAVVQFVDHMAAIYPMDRNRVYLIGYSMGGYGAWRTAAAHPNYFAAIVPISGSGKVATAMAIHSIPIWAFHGEKDTVIPLSASQEMVDSVNASGGHAKLTVLPDAGHRICNEVCCRDDLWQWLLSQATSQR